jgi:hypothetical protein
MCAFVYGVSMVPRATYGATYGLKKYPTGNNFRGNGFSINEKTSFWMCV